MPFLVEVSLSGLPLNTRLRGPRESVSKTTRRPVQPFGRLHVREWQTHIQTSSNRPHLMRPNKDRPRGGGETICARRGKNRGGSTDGCAVHTSLMAGGGEAAGSQRAYGLDSCATGQTDGWITLFQNAP